MKTTYILLSMLCALPCGADETYTPNCDLDWKITQLSSECMVGDSRLHSDLIPIMQQVGMPDQGSDKANVLRLGDWMGKTIDLHHNFKNWQEFDDYEKNGCQFVTAPQATVSISLELVTNWTGFMSNGKELGYVATNHIATVVYQDATNVFTLKTVASEDARWRKADSSSITMTFQLAPVQYLTSPCKIPWIQTTNQYIGQ